VHFIPSRAGGTAEPPVIQFVSLESESQDPEFQKEYLKLVGEEPTSVLPNDMEKLVREPPRYTEIVALFKRISDECMIVRPCNSPCLEIFMQAAYRLPAQGLDSARPMREESEAAYP
jgi:hypothetical protein